MAGTSLLALLDDIASILDDVSVMTKVATKKTAGVLGDDLALNAQQVTGVKPDRELPVVWAVAKGSFRNKAILVPAALVISAFAPWAVTPLLMAGGLFLCYEGFEKLAGKFLHHPAQRQAAHAEHARNLADPGRDVVAAESAKIKGAVRTDFILSAEIIAITLGTVAHAAFGLQVAVLVGIAVLMTIGVYGLVAGIVRLDDAGLYLSRSQSEFARAQGRAILTLAPYLMKTLSIVGTAAMFMVGGGILAHGIHPLQEWLNGLAQGAASAFDPFGAGFLARHVLPTLMNALLGVLAGAVTVGVLTLVKKVRGHRPRS